MTARGFENLRSSYVPHDPVVTDVGTLSMTYQEFADDCDINVIMRRFEATGMMPQRPGEGPQYLDLTWMPGNLQDTLAFLADAEAAFMSLPATVRREMDNDPERFCLFASDPANLSTMREWGLAPPAAVPPTAPTGVGGGSSGAGGGPPSPGASAA